MYPTVKKFFGFDDAALLEIALKNRTFIIELLVDLGHSFGPKSNNTFKGRLAIQNNSCLTVIEVFHP